MNNKDAKDILARYHAGTVTDEEKQIAEKWLIHGNTGPFDLTEQEFADDLVEMRTRLQEQTAAKTRTLWPRLAAAASIVVLLGTGTYFLLQPKPKAQTQATTQYVIHPGGNKAYLTLGNGQRISLSDAKDGVIANQGSKTIQKTADGMIVYDNSHSNHSSSEIIYNTVETPRGGQYQVVLPDGSKVWLNAATKLKYPAQFTGNDRIVELTGEAYFEVVHNAKQPFKVKTAKQFIEDIGTRFNVNAYADEPTQKTTLTEGIVKVNQLTLKPGQQAQNDRLIDNADLEAALAWKEGNFVFDNVDVKTLLRQIARWYDIEVVYQGEISDHGFGGEIKRSKELTSVLTALQQGGIHFKIEGRKLIVGNQ